MSKTWPESNLHQKIQSFPIESALVSGKEFRVAELPTCQKTLHGLPLLIT